MTSGEEGREGKEADCKIRYYPSRESNLRQPVRCLNPSVPTALPTELRDMAMTFPFYFFILFQIFFLSSFISMPQVFEQSLFLFHLFF